MLKYTEYVMRREPVTIKSILQVTRDDTGLVIYLVEVEEVSEVLRVSVPSRRTNSVAVGKKICYNESDPVGYVTWSDGFIPFSN